MMNKLFYLDYKKPNEIAVTITDDAVSIMEKALSDDEWKVITCLHSLQGKFFEIKETSVFELSQLLDIPADIIEKTMDSLNSFWISYDAGELGNMKTQLCGSDKLSLNTNGKCVIHYKLLDIKLTSEELRDHFDAFKDNLMIFGG